MQTEMDTFADRLREFRRRAVLTQAELAERAHVSEGTIIQAENGNRLPRPSTTRALARVLGVTPQELVG